MKSPLYYSFFFSILLALSNAHAETQATNQPISATNPASIEDKTKAMEIPANPPVNAEPPATNNVDKAKVIEASANTPVKAEDIKLLPHKAEYSVELDRSRLSSSDGDCEDIHDVRGSLTIQLSDTGDGLAFEQHSEIQVYYVDGSMEQSITTTVFWESHDGQNYRFNTRTLRNGAEEIARGYAISHKGLIGSVTFEEPYEFRFDLPIGTIFPLTHLKRIIAATQNGEHGLPNQVIFDGTNGVQEPVEVNVFIGGC
jgi:hypothetical protein